jgi:hypothetical protein
VFFREIPAPATPAQVAPADLLWWTGSPLKWTPRATIPVIVESVE